MDAKLESDIVFISLIVVVSSIFWIPLLLECAALLHKLVLLVYPGRKRKEDLMAKAVAYAKRHPERILLMAKLEKEV